MIGCELDRPRRGGVVTTYLAHKLSRVGVPEVDVWEVFPRIHFDMSLCLVLGFPWQEGDQHPNYVGEPPRADGR